MRRTLAYIFLSASLILATAATIGPTLMEMDSDVTYAAGKDLYFKISEKNTTSKGVLPSTYIADDAYVGVNAVAGEIEKRLETWGVNATVEKQGFDTVKVSIRAQQADATEYTYLEKYLAFSGQNITITAGTSDTKLNDEASKYLGEKYSDNAMFKGQTAKITYINNNTVPVVTIPVNFPKKDGDFDKLVTFCTSNTKAADSSAGTSATNVYLVLWANRQEGDNYAQAANSSAADYDANMANRIFFGENAANAWYDASDDDYDYTQFQMIPNSEALTENGYDSSKSGAAYKAAFFYMNLMNASSYRNINSVGYDVSFSYSVDMPATVESLVAFGDWNQSPAWNATMLASVLCFAIGVCLLIAYYRMGTLAIVSNVAVGMMGSLLLFAYFHAQFGVGALAGLLLGALVTAFGGIYYFAKMKEEIYKGRTLKKSHQEAIKKSLWPTIDAGIVSIVIGLCVYGLIPSVLGKLGLMLVFSGFFGSVSNILLLRLEGYFLANDSANEKHLALVYGVDEKKVPDAMKDEKQTYFGPYADTKFDKNSKVVGIVASALLVASIVGISVFSAVKGSAYNYSDAYQDGTTISLEYRVQKGSQATLLLGDETQVKNDFLAHISIDGKTLDTYVNDVYSQTGEVYNSDEEKSYTVYYYSVPLSQHFDPKQVYTIQATFGGISTAYSNFPAAISQSGSTYVSNGDLTATSENVVVQAGIPSLGVVYAALSISLATLLVYYFFRYKAARSMMATLFAGGSGVLVAGFFALSRIPSTPLVSIGVIAATYLGYILALFILNKEKEIEKESREKDKTALAFKELSLTQATSQSAGDLIVYSLLVSVCLIACWGFLPKVWSWAFLGSLIGFLASLVVFLVLLKPGVIWLSNLFSKIHLDFHPFKKDNPNDLKKKSAEPEEAVFIGIND
jgi:hypothetical protein